MDNFTENQGNINLIEKAEEGFDFKSYFYNVAKDWWMFIISIVLCMSMCYVYLRYSTPMFKVRASILVDDDKKPGGMGANNLFGGDISGLLGGKSSVDNEVEILKTRFLMEKVVRDMDLNIIYYKSGRMKSNKIVDAPFKVKILNPRDTITPTAFTLKQLTNNIFELKYIDHSTKIETILKTEFLKPFNIKGVGTLKIIKLPFTKLGESEHSFLITNFDNTVDNFQKSLQVVVPNKQVTTINLEIAYPLQKEGEAILNKVIEKYIQQSISDKNEIADSTIKFIENRLLYVGRELGDVESNIQNFKQNSKIADIEEQSKLLLSNTSEYMNKLADLENQINLVDAVVGYLKDQSKIKHVVPGSILPQDPVFAELVGRYNGFLLELDRLLITSTNDNPYVKNLQERVSTIRTDMLTNLANTRNSLIISKKALQKSTNNIESEIRKVPAKERTYLDLARQQRIKQELYIFLLQKREETAISKTSNLPTSRVIDPSKAEIIPFSPKKRTFYGIALLIAIAFPLVRVYIKEILNVRILNKLDIEKKTTIAIIGEISHNESNESVVVLEDARSPISEQFRALRTNLQFFIPSRKGSTILLTSSMSGEGKSFTAVNLGAALAISGKKVLLMELDLRKPKLSHNLSMSGSFGFTNYIVDENIEANEIILNTNVHANLFVISAGPIPPNPAETLINSRMETLMAKLKTEFDYIIMDAPPIGLVADAQLLNNYADLVLYLVRQKYTYKEQLNIADELFRNKKFAKMGIIVNDISRNDGYGYGYGYGYSFSYGYGYGNELEKKKSLIDKIFKI